MKKYLVSSKGFTIVELLVVIVVIGTLAAITIVSYTGINQRAMVSIVQSDLKNASTLIGIDHVNNGIYPASISGLGLPKSDEDMEYQYGTLPNGSAYCLSASPVGFSANSYISSYTGMVQTGGCFDFPTGLLTGLVSYWNMDETSGIRNDSHGTNHLTDVNTVTSTAGKVNSASEYVKANNEYLSIVDGSQSGLDLTVFSVNFWVNVTDNAQIMSFVAKWNHSVNNQYRFEYNYTSGLDFYVASTCGSYNYTGSNYPWTPVNGQWYMLSITYDGTTAKIYIDGSLVRTSTLNRAIQNCGATFMVGGQQSSSAWSADALIDEMAIWSRTLDQNEITSLYNNGFGVQY